MNDQHMNDSEMSELQMTKENVTEEVRQPVHRKRRSERYEHPKEDNAGNAAGAEKTVEAIEEGTGIPGGMAGGKNEAGLQSAASGTGENESVNPLQELANRPSSLSAGGGSRARMLHPGRPQPTNRPAEAYRKLEKRGYPQADASMEGQARDATMRVGYAPGRMDESEALAADMKRETDRQAETEARQKRESEALREALRPARTEVQPGRSAPARPVRIREYPENRYQQRPQSQETDRQKTPGQKIRKGQKGLRILAIVLAVLIMAAIALTLLPESNGLKQAVMRLAGRDTGASTETESTASPVPDPVYAFTVSGNENQTAPADVTFSVTTAKTVTEVRLADGDGVPVAASVVHGDNADDSVWILTLHAEDEYDGVSRLQIRENEGEWLSTDYTAVVRVARLPGRDSARETATPEPAAGVGVILEQKESEGQAKTLVASGTDAENSLSEGAEDSTLPEEERQEDGMDGGEQPTVEATEDPIILVSEEVEEWAEEIAEESEGAQEIADEDAPSVEETAVEPVEAPSPEPTAEPTAEPTPESTPEPTPEPTPTPALTAEAAAEADPALISTSTVYSGSKKQKEYNRPAKEQIHMPVAGEYSKKNMGVLTFRSDAFRQNAAAGTVENASELSVAWRAEAGSARGASQTYYGIGWTGQPAIVKWSKEVRERSGLYEAKLEKVGLKEVIVAGMDGNIYFLDLEDGSLTRNGIKLGYPMKGTPSVHPSGFPYMTVGQFARKMKNRTGTIGLRQYNLYTGKEMSLIDGFDGKLHRGFNNVGSFETSALIDRTSDTMITAASNGLLYLISLNSDFDYKAGTYRQSGASTIVLKTKARSEKKDSYTAVESSVAAYDKYVFYADMGGILRCVDTNSLQTVWAVETGDAVEAAVALNLKGDSGLDLYTGNMLINRSKGAAQIRCYDALSGAEKWLTEIPVKKDKKTKEEVGVKASPLVGQNQLQGLVYFTVTGISEDAKSQLRLTESAQAVLVAIDQETGSIVWARGLDARSESSPVAVYDEVGHGWVIQAAGNGEILLMDGLTGQVIHQLTVEGEIEASPAVYNDMMVIGTTGKGVSYIYGIKIK